MKRRRPDSELTTAAIAAGVFATLGVSAHHGFLEDVNHRVRDLMRRSGPRTVRTARVITLLSETAVHPVLGWLASKAVSRALGRTTFVPFAASISEFALNKGTRLVVHQERPPGARPRTGLDKLGYPSGHTLAATAIAFSIALELAEGRSAAQRTMLFAAAGAYAGTIGWTRLTLDEHWMDQVAGGLAGGIALAIVVHRFNRARRLRPRPERRGL